MIIDSSSHEQGEFGEPLDRADLWTQQLLSSEEFSAQPQNPEEIDRALNRAEIIIGKSSSLVPRSGVKAGFIEIDRKELKQLDRSTIVKRFKENYWWCAWDIQDEDPHPDFTHNPFENPLTEAWAVGTDEPETIVYNFGESLPEADSLALQRTFQWAGQTFGRQLQGMVKNVIIGDHLAFMHDHIVGSRRPTLGMYEEYFGRMSLNGLLLGTSGNGLILDRRRNLTDQGISALEVVSTHELGHALCSANPSLLARFKAYVDWQQKTYSWSKRQNRQELTVKGLGVNYPGLPPTEYAYKSGSEDFAESLVFYRFAPDYLDSTRLDFFEEAAEEAIGRYGIASQTPSMERLAVPVYPYRPLPDTLIVLPLSSTKVQLGAVARNLIDMVERSRILEDHLRIQRTVTDRLDRL